jgi:hypothetical protein
MNIVDAATENEALDVVAREAESIEEAHLHKTIVTARQALCMCVRCNEICSR